MIKWNKLILERIKAILLNDTIWCVLGTVFGVILGFAKYFSGQTDKAIFWIVCALVCIMNMKEQTRP